MSDVTRIDKAKPRKKPRKQSQTKQADTLFSLIVRAPGRCVIAGCTKTVGLQCAHGFSRRYRPLRWNEGNAFCMCQGHHHWYTHRPLEWEDWLRARWGDEVYDALRTRALAGGRTDFKVLLPALQARYKELYA